MDVRYIWIAGLLLASNVSAAPVQPSHDESVSLLSRIRPAGAPPPGTIDLSPSVTFAPTPFSPSGSGVLTLTAHNAGPDASTAFDSRLVQNAEPYISRAFDVVGSSPGCDAVFSIIETYIAHVYIFGSIPADGSITCTFNIQFRPGTTHSFSTFWFFRPFDSIDTNPDNNRVDYTFVAIGDVPVPLPATSWPWLALLGGGALMIALRNGRKRLGA